MAVVPRKCRETVIKDDGRRRWLKEDEMVPVGFISEDLVVDVFITFFVRVLREEEREAEGKSKG